MIRRGTTPTIHIEVANDDGTPIDLSQHNVYLTITDGTTATDFQNARMTFNDDDSIDITLTQAETLAWTNKKIRVQIRAVKNSDAIATNIVTSTLEDILKEGQIS